MVIEKKNYQLRDKDCCQLMGPIPKTVEEKTTPPSISTSIKRVARRVGKLHPEDLSWRHENLAASAAPRRLALSRR